MKALLLIACLCQLSTPLLAQNFQLQQLASGLGVPWGLAFISADELLITERDGNARILHTRNGKMQKISGLPAVYAEGQGGLLDVAVAPDYAQYPWLYFTYSKSINGQGATTLARAQLQHNRLQQWQDLLVTTSGTDTSQHFGSRIAFDDQGHVYFGVGDRGERPNAQNLQNHAGSILRLQRNGALPADNPFIGQADALPEIWSYGHRNPQGLVWDNTHQRLWEIEHGPRGGDEINLIEKGQNYGWPVISYGKEYWGPVAVGEGTERAGMQQPVKVYDPSIAPGSLLYYSADAFPEWQGNLFAGALKLRHLNRITLNEKGAAIAEERLLQDLGERIRALAQSPEGWLYFSTDSGKIFVLRPN
ncbi:MAG: PQQ-dependent sugar dehydrogenase [Gammaproteobacteria bacterium]|nr:PQQ-dependent sugar dehydrogenase [Gammaproteobacteria bacterium]MBL7000647.1 PQQ-dependent sugar dehydrogenase [Gammaproteobacteria bacterium]